MSSGSKIEQVRNAIRKRVPVRLEYRKPDEPEGKRVFNAHVLHVLRKKDGTEPVFLEGIQTDGVSKSGLDKERWRRFSFECVFAVEVLSVRAQFPISEKYNPEAYKHVIAKVSLSL